MVNFFKIDSQIFAQEEFYPWPFEDYSVKNCLNEICNEEQIEAHDAIAVQKICEQGAKKLMYQNFSEYISKKVEIHQDPKAQLGKGLARDFRISRNFNLDLQRYYYGIK